MPLLLLFCKRPQQGFGKQRLAAEIGAEAAFEIEKLMLQCAMEDLANWPGPVVLAPDSEEDILWAQEILTQYDIADSLVMPQIEGSFGEKINTLDSSLREMGFDKIIYITSAAPAMTSAIYDQAAMLLQEQDVVLTPASDGGVTLWGSANAWPDLQNLHWSDADFGFSLERVCLEGGYSVGHTDVLYRVNTIEDLDRLFLDFNAKGSLSQARKALYNRIIGIQESTAAVKQARL